MEHVFELTGVVRPSIVMRKGGALDSIAITPARGRHSAAEVFRVTLGLGLASFGGPIAHFGYFERAYVRERRWLSALLAP